LDPIVILGSGLAGYSVARNLRRLDKSVAVTVVTADHGQFYSKPMLSEALSAGHTADMLVNKSAEQMADQLCCTVRTNVVVSAIDTPLHEVVLADDHSPSGSQRLRYSRLVLALGAEAIHPTVAGNGAQEILSVNCLDDYARFRAMALTRRRVLIIGAGLIGCEFANDLAGAGYQVDVVDIANQPLGRLLPRAGGELLRQRLANLGVTWRLEASVERIDRDGIAYRVTLACGATVETDIVMSAIGLRPRTALAISAGLTTARGIAVDRFLRTSAAHIYALGDCAEVEGLVLPFVTPIMHAARALALTLSGTPSALAYPAMPITVKTPACPTVVAPPPAGTQGEWQVTESSDGVRALYLDNVGKLLGFALNGKDVKDSQALTTQLPAWLSADA
jgi:rubredoxin-NAD+ reductase